MHAPRYCQAAVGGPAGWPNSAHGFGGPVTCMAVCEVIKHPRVAKVGNGFAYVAPDPEHVVTRFLLVARDPTRLLSVDLAALAALA
eukprot:tig00020564_g11448.t1